jgi:hypothetical protein
MKAFHKGRINIFGLSLASNDFLGTFGLAFIATIVSLQFSCSYSEYFYIDYFQ